MVNIKIETLRGQAEILNREADRYAGRIEGMEAVIAWMRRQEFGEAKEEIYRKLVRQRDSLWQQRREMFLLAEALRRICERYDRTEESIIESGDAYQKSGGQIGSVDLSGIRERLFRMGIHLEK